MKLQASVLKRWADTLDETLARSGLPVKVTGGETAHDGRTTFDIPAPETAWAQELAHTLGVQEVRVRLQIELVPYVVVVKVQERPEPAPVRDRPLEVDWTPSFVRTEDIPTDQGCQMVTSIRGIPFMTGG